MTKEKKATRAKLHKPTVKNYTKINKDDLKIWPLQPKKLKDFDAGAINKFWHYTKPDSLKHILKGRCIENKHKRFLYFSNLCNTNDIFERNIHKNKEYVHFFSFCESNRENLPMWSVYSRDLSKCVAITIKPSKLLTFIKGIKNVYPVEENDIRYDKKFKKNEIEIQCGFICYSKKFQKMSNNGIKIKTFERRGNIYGFTRQVNVDDYYFIKDSIWDYEREFRIVIVNKSKHHYDKIAVELPNNLVRSFNYVVGPQVIEDDEDWQQFVAVDEDGKVEHSKLIFKKFK